MPLSMTKIAYTSKSLEELRGWVEAGEEAHMRTRYRPTRHAEMIGGSLYWIINHAIVARSLILGFEKTDDGRWDIVLDRNQRILLPAKEPVRALERLLALDKAEDLLKRDILTVDLRNQLRPSLRLAPNALRELRRAQGIETVESAL